MAHVQQQILDALQAALASAGTAAAARVYVERVDPLPQTQLPALLLEEAEGGETIGELLLDGTQERIYAITIACAVQSASNYGAQARALGLQVEQLLASDTLAMAPLIALCSGGIRLAAVRMATTGEGEQTLAVRLHTWLFTYFAHQARPDTAL